jgi:hypothetical protein
MKEIQRKSSSLPGNMKSALLLLATREGIRDALASVAECVLSLL